MNNDESKSQSIDLKTIIVIGLILLSLIGLVWVFQLVLLGGGVDYYYFFYPITNLWLAGETELYDASSGNYGHLPWSVFITIPFAVLPYELGLGLLRVFSLAVLVASLIVFSQPERPHVSIPAIVIFNLSTFDMIWRGQLEAFTTLGILLAWLGIRQRNTWLTGLGFIGLMVKPPTTIPIAIFLLWLAWQRWRSQKIVISVLLPSAVVLLSFIVFGNWLPRWLTIITTYSLPTWITTIWRAASQLGLPVIVPGFVAGLVLFFFVVAWHKTNQWNHQESDLAKLMLVITATFSVTPYLLSYYFVTLMAVVLPYLAKWRISIVLLLYALTFLPILRVVIGAENSWIDIVFVLSCFFSVVLFVQNKHQSLTVRQVGS